MDSPGKVVDDFCRLCAIESQSGVTIYSAEGENLCLEEKIANCLRIEVSRDDMLPKRICQSCNLLLEDFYKFFERATQVQQTLYFLLGMNLPRLQEQEPPVCFLQENVKLESNLIKKEFDEGIVQQGNAILENEKFDLVIARDDGCSPGRDQYCDTRNKANREVLGIEVHEEFASLANSTDESLRIKDIHRRKTSPTKTGIHESVTEYIVEENMLNESSAKEKNILSEDAEEILYSETSSEEDEESKLMTCEWKKQWGILCDQCENIFSERLPFDKHYWFSHHKKPIYTCSFCKKLHEKHSSFKVHIMQHIKEGRFKCRFCGKKFCSKEVLEIHLSSIHTQKEIFICEECGMSFSSQLRLRTHLNRHRNAHLKDYRCLECGKMLQTKSGLTSHKSVHEKVRPFMCHICGKTFTQKINMQQHVKHHKGEKPHVCDTCGKGFAEKSHLNRHKSFHMEERPFQCSVCKKMYKTERCLKVHSQTHWNSRPYICSICGKGFLSSTKLKQHHNCHTGERPYACKYCERTFTNYPNWLKHTRRKHAADYKARQGFKFSEAPAALAPGQSAAIEFIEMPEVEVKEDGNGILRPLNVINWFSSDQNTSEGQVR